MILYFFCLEWPLYHSYKNPPSVQPTAYTKNTQYTIQNKKQYTVDNLECLLYSVQWTVHCVQCGQRQESCLVNCPLSRCLHT